MRRSAGSRESTHRHNLAPDPTGSYGSCDRRYRYCSTECSAAALRARCRAWQRQYRQTEDGREEHKRFQQELRDRRELAATRVSSQPSPPDRASLLVIPRVAAAVRVEVLLHTASAG